MFNNDHVKEYSSQPCLIMNNQESCHILACLQHEIENFNVCELVHNRSTRYRLDAYCNKEIYNHQSFEFVQELRDSSQVYSL